MLWLSLLVASLNSLLVKSKTIPSDNHYQITTDSVGKVWPWRSYKTSPHTPPDLKITRHKSRGELAPGHVFLSPADLQRNDGTHELSGTGYVMTTEGDLVFAAEETRLDFCNEWIGGMTDFRVQTYDGRPHIMYWNGCNTWGSHVSIKPVK